MYVSASTPFWVICSSILEDGDIPLGMDGWTDILLAGMDYISQTCFKCLQFDFYSALKWTEANGSLEGGEGSKIYHLSSFFWEVAVRM